MKRVLVLTFCLLACWATARPASVPKKPTFYARQDYVGLFTQWTSIGDVNGDGIPDLVASSEGYINVLFGKGDGTFRTGPSQSSLATGTFETVLIDLNGDGKADLIMAGGTSASAAGGFIICLSNGDGTFQSGAFYPAGTDSFYSVADFVVRDFNGDGIFDVAQVASSGVWLSTGKGDGTFNPAILASGISVGGAGVAAADFNEDGKQDLVVTMPIVGNPKGQGDGFFIILGNGDGTFQTPQHFTTPNQPFIVAAASLGANGHAGIVMSLVNQPAVAVFLGNGAGAFTGPTYLPINANDQSLAIADVNGDGIPDIVTAGAEVYVAFGTTTNTFGKAVAYPVQTGDGIYNLAIGDLRNDGRTDIVTDSQFGISVLLNATANKFEEGIFTKLTAAAGCGVAGDFNRDGKPDIAVNTSQGIQILLGTGKSAVPLRVGQSLTLANSGCLTQTGDLNGDGILDLAITTPTGVVSYLGNGDGTFTEKSTTLTAVGSAFLVLADFNHDGKLDFATYGNALALGNGDGTFQTPTPFVSDPPTGGFNNIAVGDINNDGWPDVVLTNLDLPYTNLYVLVNNKTGGFTQVPTNFGENSSDPILVDLNNDGNLDLVLNQGVYLGNGTGQFTFQETLKYPVSYGLPLQCMVADVNGDGIPDIAALAPGTVAIYLGLGNAKYATPFYLGTGPSPGYILPANLHGQKASSGLPDLVAPDESGGVVLLLNQTK